MLTSEMILRFPREVKIEVLKKALDENSLSLFLELSKILLDAPITKGGIETEVIEKIHSDYLESLKTK